jgi:predicted O-methyltransferase YrrM
MITDLFINVDTYITHLFAHEDDVLLSVTRSIRDAGMPQYSITPSQGKMLHIMATLCHAKTILEIGTLGGYSTIWLARALPPDGKLITIEINPAYAEVARKNIDNAGLQGKVKVKTGDALKILNNMDEVFDMVFLDAHKPSYTRYFTWSLRHTHSGSLIVADNVIREGKVLDADSNEEDVVGVQQFNVMLATTKEVTATIIPTVGIKGFDGMAVAVVR